jgi:hypothetical protein
MAAIRKWQHKLVQAVGYSADTFVYVYDTYEVPIVSEIL